MDSSKPYQEAVRQYQNKNAKSNCPECDSLNTHFKKSVFVCFDCGHKEVVQPLDKETIAKLLKISLAVAVGVISYTLIF